MNTKAMRSNLMLVLTAFIWGVAFVAQSVGMDYVGPFTFNSVRNFVAALVLLPCIKLLDKVSPSNIPDADAKHPHGGPMLIIGGIICGVCLAVASSFQQMGIAYTTVGKAGFITAMYIVIVPILGLFIKKKVRPIAWISVAIAVAGLYLLCMTESFALSKGDFLILLCAFCFALHIMVIDYFSPKVDGVRMSLIQFITCGVICAIPALMTEAPDIQSIIAAWMPILYAGAMSSAVGYTLQIVAQKNTDPVIASLLMSLESAFSLLAGWVILNQRLSPKELCGCVLMFIAILLSQLPEKHPDKQVQLHME